MLRVGGTTPTSNITVQTKFYTLCEALFGPCQKSLAECRKLPNGKILFGGANTQRPTQSNISQLAPLHRRISNVYRSNQSVHFLPLT